MTVATREKPRSMLVILMGSIGDVARGLTIASGLKRAFPETKLSWLVEPTCAPLVRANPLIDEVLVFERRTPLQGVIKLRGELRERSFDVTLDLQRHLKSGFFSWLSGASRRIGFHPRDSKEGNWLFQTEYIEAAPKDYSKLRHYQLFLKALGITPPSEPEFVPAAPTTAEASALMREAGAPFVLFVLGSSWESKNWFGEGYARLLSLLLEHTSLSAVLAGDRSQSELSAALAAQFGKRVVNTIGRTTLADLNGLLVSARACVGPDSGPAHMAAAVGTPHITLFGPTSPERTAPYGSEHLVIRSPIGCAPCYRRRCPGLGRLCMRMLSPEAVWSRLQSVLAARP